MSKHIQHQSKQNKYLPGFNFIEILLSIGLFATLIAFTVPVYRTFQIQNETILASGVITQVLRRAQWEARASNGDTSWGVNVSSSAITLFQGDSYLTRNPDEDDVYLLGGITPTGLLEVVFSGVEGTPDATGTLTLTGPDNSSRSITIGAYGQVFY